ncbi:DUF3800 domain-containing protein [Comamonas sp. NoAH]|uniref:DUF3800 domain-containing protein n=1 Tax=Comamonas halotolerans TaxID=3041496 RepID=UPI0024E04EF9|nr:DUF3800 domain-containing protein [Comamonas sp. NoAH]
MTQAIYFDEAGFTGNHLLDPNQRFFVYASVVTNDEEAKEFVESLISRYNIQNGELKGGSLVRHHTGRKAIDEILKEFDGRLLFTIAEKKYALACKLFEYIFEPCISDINTMFYGCDFHKFVATILYVEFMARGAGAEQIFEEFEALMRSPDDTKLALLFSASTHPENSPIITKVREFAQHRAADIKAELDSLSRVTTGKWVLDITCTSLHSLLSRWGTKYETITAICDNSKPLQQAGDFFDAMIGYRKQLFGGFDGANRPMTFNLSGPIDFRDSKTSHGIQLADALAGAAVHVWSGATDDHAKKWKERLSSIANLPVLPDAEEIDLRRPTVRRNLILLHELHRRAINNQSLIEGMPEVILMISQRFGLKLRQYSIN